MSSQVPVPLLIQLELDSIVKGNPKPHLLFLDSPDSFAYQFPASCTFLPAGNASISSACNTHGDESVAAIFVHIQNFEPEKLPDLLLMLRTSKHNGLLAFYINAPDTESTNPIMFDSFLNQTYYSLYFPLLDAGVRNPFINIDETSVYISFRVDHENKYGGAAYAVSAIVSSYKASDEIQQRLLNLTTQSLYQKQKLEIVVVDSGSPQLDALRARIVQNSFRSITVLRTEKRETIYAAWNRALPVARGCYLTNANTDDRLRFDALEIFTNYLDTHPDTAIVHADQAAVQEADIAYGKDTLAQEGHWKWGTFSKLALLLNTQVGSQPVWRASLHSRCGFFDSSLSIFGDMDFYIRASQFGTIDFIPEVLGVLNLQPGSLSQPREIKEPKYTIVPIDLNQKYGMDHLAVIHRHTAKENLLRFYRGIDAPIESDDLYQNTLNDFLCDLAEEAERFRVDYWFELLVQIFCSAAKLNLKKHAVIKNIIRLYSLKERKESVHDLTDFLKIPDDDAFQELVKETAYDTSFEYLSQENSAAPVLSVIIPVFNKSELTKQCLSVLYRSISHDIHFEVIIIDNHSTDDTEDFLQSALTTYPNLRVHRCEDNLGFAKANNIGAQMALGEYLLLLNNDTEPLPGFLKPLLHILEHDDSVAAVGPKLLFPDGTIQHAGVVIMKDFQGDPLVARHIHYTAPGDFPAANVSICYQALTAACLLIRKSVFLSVGGFDETFWNGYEDVDLCLQIGALNMRLVYEPKGIVFHHESKSGKERFAQVDKNIARLHEKWLGKVVYDIVEESGGIRNQNHASPVKRYFNGLSSIIIPLFNNLEYTKLCLSSIEQTTQCPYELILIDNASTDGTDVFLKSYKKSHKRVNIITNTENLGFPKAINQGLKIASGDYIAILNNDIVLTKNWLELLIDALEVDPKVGIAGPVSNSVSGPQRVSDAEYDHLGNMQHYAEQRRRQYANTISPFPRVAFLCTLIKRSVVEAIGGLDDRFSPGNFEDDDFCLRAQLTGFTTVIRQDVFVHHFGSKSFKAAGEDAYMERLSINHKHFIEKWGADPEDIWLRGVTPKKRTLQIPLSKSAVWMEPLDRALLLIQDGDYPHAYRFLQSMLPVMNLYTEHFGEEKSASLFELIGKTAILTGKLSDAPAYLSEAAQLHPSPRIFEMLGDAYLSGNRTQDAVDAFRSALSLDPKSIPVLDKLNRLLY